MTESDLYGWEWVSSFFVLLAWAAVCFFTAGFTIRTKWAFSYIVGNLLFIGGGGAAALELYGLITGLTEKYAKFYGNFDWQEDLVFKLSCYGGIFLAGIVSLAFYIWRYSADKKP